jgi:2-methylcitrate dehydratase
MAASHENPGGETIRVLARLVHSTETESIPAPAMRQAQLLLLDTIGCGIAGARDEVSRAVAEFVLSNGSKSQCALIGRAQRTSVLNAVLANGVAVRVLDLNDYLIGEAKGEPETAGHPSDNIPVALAIGAARASAGADVLASIVIGYELYARLQHLTDRSGGWDAVTVSGLVAPAMAGRLMGLDEERLAHALALGAARAATPAIVRTGHISAAKSIGNALVAQSGVQAALLAERGLTGPLPILDDARGLRDLFAHADPSALTQPIPADGAIVAAHVKAYPCVNTAQSAVTAALALHRMMQGNLDGLVRLQMIMADYVVVKRHQEDKGRARPASREAADHSFPFVVAVALLDGAFGIAQFDNERWRDPRVMALMEKIVMRRDAALNFRAPGAFPCTLRAEMADGNMFGIDMDYPPGFSRDGLDPNAVIEKFHAVSAPVLSQSARERIVDAVMEFDHSRTTATLDNAIAIEGNST